MAKNNKTEQLFQFWNKRTIPSTPEKTMDSINKAVSKITEEHTPGYNLTFEENALVEPIYKTMASLWLSEISFKDNNYFIRVHLDRMIDYISTFLCNHLDNHIPNKPNSDDRKAMKKFERKRDDIVTQFEKAFK